MGVDYDYDNYSEGNDEKDDNDVKDNAKYDNEIENINNKSEISCYHDVIECLLDDKLCCFLPRNEKHINTLKKIREILNYSDDYQSLLSISQNLMSVIIDAIDPQYNYTSKISINTNNKNANPDQLYSHILDVKNYLDSIIHIMNNNNLNASIYRFLLSNVCDIILCCNMRCDEITYDQLNMLYNIELFILSYPINNTPQQYCFDSLPQNKAQSIKQKIELLKERIQIHKSMLDEYRKNESNDKEFILNIEEFLNIDQKYFNNIIENFNSNVKIDSTLMSLFESNNNSQIMQIRSQIKLVREKLNEYEKNNEIYNKENKLSQLYDEFNKIKQNYNIQLLYYYQLLIDHKDILSKFINKLPEHPTHKTYTFLKWLLSVTVKTYNNKYLQKFINKSECIKTVGLIVDKLTNNLNQQTITELLNNLQSNNILDQNDIATLLKMVLQDNTNQLLSSEILKDDFKLLLRDYKDNNNTYDLNTLINDCIFGQDVDFLFKIKNHTRYDEIMNKIDVILNIISAIFTKRILELRNNNIISGKKSTQNKDEEYLAVIMRNLYKVTKKCMENSISSNYNVCSNNSQEDFITYFIKSFKIIDRIKTALIYCQNNMNISTDNLMEIINNFNILKQTLPIYNANINEILTNKYIAADLYTFMYPTHKSDDMKELYYKGSQK